MHAASLHHWKTYSVASLVFAALGYLFWSSTTTAHVLAQTDTDQRPFVVAVLPDTQYYSQTYTTSFLQQTKWIAANHQQQNIVFVTHEGDIVENWDDEQQWRTASAAMAVLDPVVPYGIAPGNHDVYPDGSSPYFERYFPLTRVGKVAPMPLPFLSPMSPNFGSFGTKNSYWLFSAGGREMLAMNLEFCPADATLEWANGVLDHYSDRTAIITTHSFLNAAGQHETRAHSCDAFNGAGKNAGQDIWQKLVAGPGHSNVRLILNGHDIWSATGSSRRTDIVNGLPVHQLMADYQQYVNGGDGLMRLITFDYPAQKLRVTTFSPITGQYLSDPANQFELPLPR